MRKREKILELVNDLPVSQTLTDVRLGAILEVLLDIRDLLTK